MSGELHGRCDKCSTIWIWPAGRGQPRVTKGEAFCPACGDELRRTAASLATSGKLARRYQLPIGRAAAFALRGKLAVQAKAPAASKPSRRMPLKVYVWQGFRRECPRAANGSHQTREVVAATSKTEARRLAGHHAPGLSEVVETGNAAELAVALGTPGVVFWHPLDVGRPSHAWARAGEAWVDKYVATLAPEDLARATAAAKAAYVKRYVEISRVRYSVELDAEGMVADVWRETAWVGRWAWNDETGFGERVQAPKLRAPEKGVLDALAKKIREAKARER